MFYFGIGDKFSYKKRRWIVKNLKDKMYTCETIDNDKKELQKITLSLVEMYKIVGAD